MRVATTGAEMSGATHAETIGATTGATRTTEAPGVTRTTGATRTTATIVVRVNGAAVARNRSE
jgi:hypothetical protein